MNIDTYSLSDFEPGDRVWCFHPGTLGVMYWGTVEKIGRKYLTVRMAPTGDAYRIPPSDVGERA
jgi:hypothetical protein